MDFNQEGIIAIASMLGPCEITIIAILLIHFFSYRRLAASMDKFTNTVTEALTRNLNGNGHG